MSTRHRTASDELEGRILDAALQLLGEKGVEALTVRGIATRANVAPMGIYNHFDGKMGVYEALWVEGFERLTETMDGFATTGDPLEDMVNCGLRYRTFALENRAHYRLMFLEHVDEFNPSAEAASVSGQALQILITGVEAAQRAGQFPPGRPINYAQAIWATVHGYVSLELLRINFSTDADATYEALLRAIYRGFSQLGVPI
jgi:AcrR family transcriptional regulator